jgi:hypothetical protein
MMMQVCMGKQYDSAGRVWLGSVWSQLWFTSEDMNHQAASADRKPIVRERGSCVLTGYQNNIAIYCH